MRKTSTALIADEDQDVIQRVQAAFGKKVAKAQADYKRSITQQLAQSKSKTKAKEPKPASSGRVRG